MAIRLSIYLSIYLKVLRLAKYDSLCVCMNVCIHDVQCIVCFYVCIGPTCKYAYLMYLCPYFVVFKTCIVGVSETCRMLFKVYLFVSVLFMDKHV